jgi:THO complex subunit 3
VSVIDAKKYKIVKEHKFQYEVNEMCWHRNGDHFLLTTGKGTIEVLNFPDFEDVSTIEVCPSLHLITGHSLRLSFGMC